MKERFKDTYFSLEHRYSLGIDLAGDGYFLSFPVTNGVVDYEEHYLLTSAQYELLMTDQTAALMFLDECRRHEHDELLAYRPHANRGIPS